MIYFDNGATTYPKPAAVKEILPKAMELYGGNPGRSGHDLSLQTAVAVYECRGLAAELFGSTEEDVVFTQNCTTANNFAIKGALSFGDHVLISDLEHNAVARPIHALFQKGTISYDVVTTYEDDEKTVDSFRKMLRPNTKMVCCTHGSNVFGTLLPVAKIGKMARQNGVYMMVDAAQTAGVVDIKLERDCIDFLCAAGHKSLYGPFGTGLLITAKGQALSTLMEGGTGSHSLDLNQPTMMPDRFESGTVNVLGIVGLAEGLRFLKAKGTDAIYRHEMELVQFIYKNLAQLKNVELYGGVPTLGKTLPVLSFNLKGVTGEQTAMRLNTEGIAVRGGFHCAFLAHNKMGTTQTGTTRISLGAFNTMEEAQQFCRVIKKLSDGVE